MANLIITVIAIALVAMAALMGAYYGGSAFLSNEAAANAATVLNQAQQITAAWNAYKGDNLNTPPTSFANLINGQYLTQMPIPPVPGAAASPPNLLVITATATIGGVAGTHYFVIFDVGTPASPASITSANFASCLRIIKTAIGPTAANALTAIPAARDWGTIFNGPTGNGTFGCAPITGVGFSIPGSFPAVVGWTNGDYGVEYLLQ